MYLNTLQWLAMPYDHLLGDIRVAYLSQPPLMRDYRRLNDQKLELLMHHQPETYLKHLRIIELFLQRWGSWRFARSSI